MTQFISHVQIPVKNLEETVEWYVSYLDCEFIANFGDFALIRFREDRTNIFLWQTADETTATFSVNGESFPTIGFQVNDMDALCKKIVDSGTRVYGDPLAPPVEEGRRFLKFFDLNGNMLVAHTE
ncbi:VOC family protein [Paenibacillus sp. MMO-177]|uniref:VOC family protein n=1 Tax=Paenibacillus sp. MMO-177 TaxID=3081289 RepID=UPI0030175F23